MKIGFGCDHSALELKKALMEHLQAKGHECVDYGTYTTESVDYPDYGELVARKILAKEVDKGVLICGTGIGISVAANKVPGIIAAVCSDTYSAAKAVEHNNADIIALGARTIGDELAKVVVDAFFEAEFQGGRHAQRVAKIQNIH